MTSHTWTKRTINGCHVLTMAHTARLQLSKDAATCSWLIFDAQLNQTITADLHTWQAAKDQAERYYNETKDGTNNRHTASGDNTLSIY